MKRLLTIGHSYVVAANRRLADEMARQGAGRWTVTAVAPARFRGDLREISVEPLPDERCELRTLRVRAQRLPHGMWYEGLDALMREDWDAVHCWEEPYIRAGAQIARAVRPGRSFVPATFQNIAKRYPWPLAGFERTTMTRADAWIAFGHSVEEALAGRSGYAGKPRRVIPPGVDIAAFRPDDDRRDRVRHGIGWPSDAFVVGFLGRFTDAKGVRLLCAALEDVRAPWKALFVGGGPLERELHGFARRHPGDVHVATGVPHDDVPAWLNAMSVLCAPSQTTRRWREQFGRMLIEAMASAVPVIASRSGEIPHVVGDAACVIDERDLAAWTRAIERLAADGGERTRLADAGRARASSRFAWSVTARQHLALFEELLGT